MESEVVHDYYERGIIFSTLCLIATVFYGVITAKECYKVGTTQ